MYKPSHGDNIINTQFDQFAAPLKEINELSVKNFETVADLNLKAAEENVKIGIEQVKNAAGVSDAESWKNYLASQAEVTQGLNDRMVENAKTVVELGNAYAAEMQRIFKDSFAVK
ncbi:MAG: TIGR01841 family phasin [Gammaproteobacteria bacterium]|nr:TIGR01841 family phasin [Gammaproteobacteria bacterium]